jgi:hypothetical protein
MDRFPSTWVLLQFYYTYMSGLAELSAMPEERAD